MGSPYTKGRYSDEETLTYFSDTGTVAAPKRATGTSRIRRDRQVVTSQGNPYSLLGKTGSDIGGAFSSNRAVVEGGREISCDRLISAFPSPVNLRNTFFAFASPEAASLCSQATTTAAFEKQRLDLSAAPVGSASMLSAGATAISRVAPTNPCVDLSTSMAELLREGLPSLPGRSGNAGGEYLNYQFGIAPLASDIRDLRNTVKRADALWAQYARNSGKGIRRRYEFPKSVSTTTKVTSPANPQYPSIVGGYQKPSGTLIESGTLFQSTTVTQRMWFSGSFTYYLPDSQFGAMIDRLDRLYGLRPGIDTLYQLTPWSWLVDYFSNLGDVVQNLNSFTQDGLIMPYAYIMCETTYETQSYLDFRVWRGTGWKAERLTDSVVRQTKQRMPATPFGFGLSDGSLTGRQQAILVALGISRR